MWQFLFTQGMIEVTQGQLFLMLKRSPKRTGREVEESVEMSRLGVEAVLPSLFSTTFQFGSQMIVGRHLSFREEREAVPHLEGITADEVELLPQLIQSSFLREREHQLGKGCVCAMETLQGHSRGPDD